MKALYAMQYAGQESAGVGALYVGDGFVLGVDIGGCRYEGSYTESGGRLRGQATMSAPDNGTATLVTGQELEPGQSILLEVDWPFVDGELADGEPRALSVAGLEVLVTFEKVGDIL